MNKIIAFLSLIFISASYEQVHTLYTSLNQDSIPEHLAFYRLYPDTTEGKESLEHAWKLLTKGQKLPADAKLLSQLSPAIDTLVTLIAKDPGSQTTLLNHAELDLIHTAAKNLPNRRLKGYYARSEEEVLNLPTEDIDLAHGLFLSVLGENETQRMLSYEAMIDLMALQILAKLPPDATPRQKIAAINSFIFEEMGFRFPPHSLYSKDIDLYTFLPAVLDSRRGVCLGVSILYLCISQRLDLPLEIITPPGHIYVRYNDGEEINIETTARGVHVDSENYLSLDTRSLQQRTLKEVIGMAHFNDAGRFWHTEEYQKVHDSYVKAYKYMKDDNLVLELLGYSTILIGEIEEAKKILSQVAHLIPEYAVSGETMAQDFLDGKVDGEGLQVIFMHVDETHESIKKKQEKLKAVLQKYPQFRAGIFALATTWLQLHRLGEGLEILEQYHQIDSTDPTVEYYLTVLYAMRMDYRQAWKHFEITQKLTSARNHNPKALKELRKQLVMIAPLDAEVKM